MFSYKYDDLFNPTLVVLRQLGGSATIEELKNGWKTQVLEIIRTISPASFERLTQRLTERECGLVKNSEALQLMISIIINNYLYFKNYVILL